MKKKGKVQYKSSSEKSFKNPLKSNASLFDQDQIRTGPNGFTKFVYLDDGSAIKIHHDSEVYVQGFVDKRNIIKQINMINGRMKLDVNEQTSTDFIVITPSSVASIKGTRFWIVVDEDGGDQFYGLTGSVEVTNNESGESILLVQSTTVISLPDGTLSIEPTETQEIQELEELEIEFEEPTEDMPEPVEEEDDGSGDSEPEEDEETEEDPEDETEEDSEDETEEDSEFDSIDETNISGDFTIVTETEADFYQTQNELRISVKNSAGEIRDIVIIFTE